MFWEGHADSIKPHKYVVLSFFLTFNHTFIYLICKEFNL